MEVVYETVNAGLLAFVPAVAAIVAVFVLRDVIASLFIGLILGTAIYAIYQQGGLLVFFNLLFTTIFNSAIDNMALIGCILLLGSLVSVITLSGGHFAYGRWVVEKIKTARGASLATLALGTIIFIDDYFSCLLTGAVMGDTTDTYKISREKLAYFIDSTAGPICILAPISSWAPTITQVVEDAGIENGLFTFITSIPFNYYAIFTVLFAIFIAISRKDLFTMRISEQGAQSKQTRGALYGTEREIQEKTLSGKGRMVDLVLPNVVIVVLILLTIAWLGGYFGPEKISLVQAYMQSDVTFAINIGALGALLLCFLLYIPRRLLTVRQFFEGAIEGMKSMFMANLILVMAWSLSSITIDALGAGTYVDTLMQSAQHSVNLAFLPVVIFIISGSLAFGLGSWGTFMMTIPFIAIITRGTDPVLFPLFLGATLAGSVLGDHASPITDTTTLASISAKCGQIEHVKTQLPYVLIVSCGSIGSFICMGFIGNPLLSFAIGAVIIAGSCGVLYQLEKVKYHGMSIGSSI
jgi:Na+/H+ antiporter NhaC